jgi:hypothetical protein
MAQGPNKAAIVGSLGRIEIDRVWYCQTSFTVRSREDELLSRYEEGIAGRGMQYQALEVEARIRAGAIESPTMSHRESLEVMATMDEVRRQVGVTYPGE